jgi:uncharacterized membrane protein YkoI
MSSRLTTLSVTLAGAAAALAIAASSAAAQKPKPKISKDSAAVIARAQVPNGKIQSSEYEHEKGRWIYSFDIKVAGKSGIEEINVDAMTGAVVAHEHEGAKAEAAEKRAEATKKP